MMLLKVSTPRPDVCYLQEADGVLHVGQAAQVGAPPAQPCHLLLQAVDPPLHPAAQRGLVAAEELADPRAHDSHILGQLRKRVGVLLLQGLDQSLEGGTESGSCSLFPPELPSFTKRVLGYLVLPSKMWDLIKISFSLLHSPLNICLHLREFLLQHTQTQTHRSQNPNKIMSSVSNRNTANKYHLGEFGSGLLIIQINLIKNILIQKTCRFQT